MEKLIYQRFLLAKDNFYDHPEDVVQIARSQEFYEPEHSTGFRSKTVYHEPGIKKKLERILGIKITRWDTDPLQENGIFYQGFSKGSKRETPGVHSDWPFNDITCLIYLTPNLPIDCGTSLWMHKETQLTDPATPKDAKKLGLKHADLINRLEEDSQNRSQWIEVDRIGYKFNRMVAYPSGVLHSASKHFGDSITNGRIYQTFRIGVDWSTFNR